MGYMVIFRSTRVLDDGLLYADWSHKMEILVQNVEGYRSHFGFRDSETRTGVTVSYFDSLEAIERWRNVTEHQLAQRLGREEFYESYSVQVCKILREYEFLTH